MAYIKKDGSSMGLPMNINRGNPVPLDTTEVWYSLEEAKSYAASGPTAYVGQQIAVVDEANQTATIYVIWNTGGDLKPVGSGALGDEKSIVVENGVLSLHSFGKEYYKYIPATEDVPAHYELTTGFGPGLIGKIHETSDGQYELSWYEPSSVSVEELAEKVDAIEQAITWGELPEA